MIGMMNAARPSFAVSGRRSNHQALLVEVISVPGNDASAGCSIWK